MPSKTLKARDNAQKVKTRYSDAELEEFRVLIEQKLEQARKELNYHLAQLTDMADNPDAKIKGLDDGIGTAENERLSIMAARQQKLIQHLENALVRIKNKVYGVCRSTGKLIPKERLRAVPHATLSIEAKQNRTR
jgi:RNA polymerase-binding protein DksA